MDRYDGVSIALFKTEIIQMILYVKGKRRDM